MYRTNLVVLCSLLVLGVVTSAQSAEWTPITGAEALENYMSGLKAERSLSGDEVGRGEYSADGTGVLSSWGASIQRTWAIQGDDQICISAERERNCYTLERNNDDPTIYRVKRVGSNEVNEFQRLNDQAIAKGEAKTAGSAGGAAAPSADELAAELSNPNTAVATLNFKNQVRWFEGDLPDAEDQTSYSMVFQPILPFVLDSGDKIIWRPAVPLMVDQPVFDGSGFGGESGLGDIIMDLAYAPTNESGILTAFGLITSIPTATDNDLGTGRWTLGPEMLVAKTYSKGLYGIFPNHQWDVAGWGEADISLTTIQPLYTYLPGGGWNVGTAPAITYDWNSEQWTVPLQLNAGKTVVWNGRPWKLSVELNYYVEKADAIGPEWMLSFNIAPVVKNGLASLVGLGD